MALLRKLTMAADTKYLPVPYLFKSRGLIARDITDRAPENTYLNMMNCQEREESAMSSRYGTLIINRNPQGSGTSNYPFPASVVSLARLVYQGSSYRYAYTSAGTLYRRAGDTQGSFTSIYTGLSGEAFDSIVTNCFQSSKPYLFIYDKSASIKEGGTGTPTLVGIDPPSYPASAAPFSPLLTLIDSFASGNSYTTSNVTAWAHSSVATLTSSPSSQNVSDFAEYFQVQVAGGASYTPTTSSTSVSVSQVGSGTKTATSTPVFGFSSVVASSVQATVNLAASVVFASLSSGSGQVQYQYSIDSGSTWTNFYTWTSRGTGSLPTSNVSVSIFNLTNISTLRFQIVVSAQVLAGTITTNASINSVIVSVSPPNVFGSVVSGMLTTLGSSALTGVGIISMVSSGLSGGVYTTFTATTSAAHGMGGAGYVAVYGTSNPLADGFYKIVSSTTNTLILQVATSGPAIVSAIDATGGTVYSYIGGSTNIAVLANLYASPYPPQMSVWGFYEQVSNTITSFPVGCWSGTVASNTTGTVLVNTALDISINKQVTDDDLIVLTLRIGTPANVANVRLQFDVASTGYTSAYYYKDISPAYYQGSVSGTLQAYEATQQQILADTLGLINGQIPNSTSAQLQPGNFSTGAGAWQTVYMRRGDFIPVGNAGSSSLDWGAISGWKVIVTTNTNGSSTVGINGLYLQWGYGPSSIGGVGYNYRYTYYNANTGTESNASPIQNFSAQFGYLSTINAPIFLRQAVQVSGSYSSDSQVTHVRIYRQGGIYNDNWRMIDQIGNVNGNNYFLYKDVIPDASLAQANLLALDNDPPVTSVLQNPITTTLSAATANTFGNTPYQPVSVVPQIVSVGSGTFVANQIVLVGEADNIEEVRVIAGGTNQFTAVLWLQHNAGEPVVVTTLPRQACNLAAIAYGQVWVAGDPNNPGYLYYSKRGYPESFGAQNYINVSSPSDPINAVINWRGTLYVGTLTTWYIIQGGTNPNPQPTGSQHGIIARQGWIQTESAIWYRAADGLREFRGSEGTYMTLPVEWMYRNNSLTPLPLVDNAQASNDVMCYYNNAVYTSFVALDGNRYRLIYDTIYRRYRIDSLPMTAMLWEMDTNTFLGAYQSPIGYAVVQDQVYSMDYDDGGWSGASLVKTPIVCTVQLPYQDLGAPHFAKNWNILELDANTQNQALTTNALFDDGAIQLILSNVTSASRQKLQIPINSGQGQQGYRISLKHTISVTAAPILYQEDIYSATLAAYRYSFDTYWILGGSNLHKLVKQCVFDYTSTTTISYSLYADNSSTPYHTFTLPAAANRSTIKVRFPAIKLRQFRVVGNVTSGTTGFQQWKAPQLWWKPVLESSGYEQMEMGT